MGSSMTCWRKLRVQPDGQGSRAARAGDRGRARAAADGAPIRHACGLIYLSAHPGGHEVVRRLLGHRSSATTLTFYAGMETAALRRYDAVILERRQAAGSKDPGRG